MLDPMDPGAPPASAETGAVDSAAGPPADVVVPGPTADAGRVLGELAVVAARIGTFDWELSSGVLVWDEHLRDIFGEPRGTAAQRTIDDFFTRVHPDDAPHVRASVEHAVAVTGAFDDEYRIVLPTGHVRWVAARGRVLRDTEDRPVRLLGAAYDVTAAQEGELRTGRVLESMPTAFFSLDRRWRFTYVNAEAERVLDTPREELLGGVVWDLFPSAVGTEFEERYRGAVASGRPVAFDAYYPPPLDAWYEVRAWPGPDGLAVYFLDVTARRRAQEETERARQRADLLAQVTAQLTETLDADEAVGHVAELLVPTLADWCIVTVAAEDGRDALHRGLRDVGWAHRDPARSELVGRYAERRLEAMTEQAPLVQALVTGRAVTLTGATTTITHVLRSAEARRLLEELAPESAVVLPLRGRAGTVGLITLFADADRAPLTTDEVALAREVAGRAGLALDNSRLLRQQRQLAEGLQRALLTRPPRTDGLEVAVRYAPAGEAAQVGGDWYDAFVQRDGGTVVVIGDVVGHDIVAAAAMAQLRSLVRGIAVSTGADPADLLGQVDRAMRTLGASTLATAVVARVAPPEVPAEGPRSVRWSNAGHPPPLVLAADGRVAELSDGNPDLLLGVVPETERTGHTVTLQPGDTLVLYTDGLVERRDLPLTEGIAGLRRALEAAAHLPLEEMCDAVLARLLTVRRHDDVAVVAVRVRPVGPEAGTASP